MINLQFSLYGRSFHFAPLCGKRGGPDSVTCSRYFIVEFYLLLMQIETEDADSGAGGMVVYSINSADPFASRDIFYINETTGVITVVGVLDREFRTVVTLSISAEDMGNPGEQ